MKWMKMVKKKNEIILKVGDCFWTVSIAKFILRFSNQLLFSIIMIHNNCAIDWIHTPGLCGPTNILILIWMENFVKINIIKTLESYSKKAQDNSYSIDWRKKIFLEFVYFFLFMFLSEMGTTANIFLPSLLIPIRTALFYLYFNCEPKTLLSFTRNTRVFRRKQSNSLLSIIFRVGERNYIAFRISKLAFFCWRSIFFEFLIFLIILTRKFIMTKWHKQRDEDTCNFPHHEIIGAHERDSWTFW